MYTTYAEVSTAFLYDLNSVKELTLSILEENASKWEAALKEDLKEVKVGVCGMKLVNFTKEIAKNSRTHFSYIYFYMVK